MRRGSACKPGISTAPTGRSLPRSGRSSRATNDGRQGILARRRIIMLGPTAHVDTFARDNLPPFERWPEFLLANFPYPDELNAAVELTDRMVDRGFGDHVALIGNGRRRTYKELADWTNRLPPPPSWGLG